MIRKLLYVCVLVALAFAGCRQNGSSSTAQANRLSHSPGAVKFYVDPSHSSINFKVQFMALATVTGRFDQFFGEIYYDETDIVKSSVDITVRTASIDTRNKKRDNDVRDSLLEPDKYPGMTFRSDQVMIRDGKHFAVGALTIHGESREMEAPFEILNYLNEEGKNKEMGVQVGPLTINRGDFGMNGVRLAGQEIELTVYLRLREPWNKEAEIKYREIELDSDQLQGFTGTYDQENGDETLYVEMIAGKLTARFDAKGDMLWNMMYQIVPYDNETLTTNFRFVNHGSCYLTFYKESVKLIFRMEGDNAVEWMMAKARE